MWSVGFVFPFFSLCLLPFCFYDFSIFFEWSFFISEVSFLFSFLVDSFSLVFFMTVSLVSFGVLVFSESYMESDLFKKKFMISLVFFVVSMALLIFSSHLFWVMIGWDGLGLSSFFLIVFFQNWKSFNSAMVTFLTNRLGDCFILLTLCWGLVAGSSWVPGITSFLVGGFLMIGAFSKSAQFPFSAWLPLAMAAPTPVSSLVHSSTLVTAGVFLLIRFNFFFSEVLTLISVFSVLTIVIAGTSSLGEMDLKKVIAFSTLSHIGLMIFSVSQGFTIGAFVHLILHAFFKSLLFMISGVLIHNCEGSQDIRKMSFFSLSFPVGCSFVVCLLSMIGAPFLSGFFSKEVLFSKFNLQEGFSLCFFFLSVLLTSSYSFRLLKYLLYSCQVSVKKVSVCLDEVVFFVLSVFSVTGSLLIKSVSLFMFEESVFFLPFAKSILFFSLFLGFFLGNSIFNYLSIGKFFHESWFFLSVSTFYQKMVFKLSWWMMFKGFTKGFLESTVIFGWKTLSKFSQFQLKLIFHPFLVFEGLLVSLFLVIFLF